MLGTHHPSVASIMVTSPVKIGALLLILLAWIGTYFPWTTTGVTAFSVNLYDLAEWSSLNPAVRSGPFPLLATFCLRATVGLLAFRLTLQAASSPGRTFRWTIRALALLIAIGLLPPMDFFRGAFDDPNYRQQFIVAVVSGIAILAAWRVSRVSKESAKSRVFPTICMIANGLALVLSVVGLIIALQALGLLGLHVGLGFGAMLTLIATLLLLLMTAFSYKRQQPQ